MKNNILQGEVFLCQLEGIESEQLGERPVIIVQLNALNRTSPNVIIVPVTSKNKKELPTHYILSAEDYNFLTYPNSTVLCEGIRTISKSKLIKHLGYLKSHDLQNILNTIKNCFVEVKEG